MRKACNTMRVTVSTSPVRLDISLSGRRFIHLDDAADYLIEIYTHQRATLNAIVRRRKEKGHGSLFDDTARVKRMCERGIDQHVLVKAFVLRAINNGNFSDVLQKDHLTRFGRAIAMGEFILRDTVSLIEQSVPAVNTVSITDMPNDEAVREWIDAERKPHCGTSRR